MRITVTGGAGFIGSHLVRQLLSESHEVVVVDNLSGDSVVEPPRSVELVCKDTSDLDALTEAVEGSDAVVHLAANVLVRGGHTDTRKDIDGGVLSTYNTLEAMRRAEVRHICFASSANAYGDQGDRQPIVEDAPLRPISLYGAAKASGEALISAYVHLFGISASILRFAIVLGRGLRRGIVYDFVQRLEQDPTKLVVLGNGRQTKSYVAIEDCVTAVMQLGLTNRTGLSVYNVAAEGALRVLEVAEEVTRALELSNVTITPRDKDQQGWPGDIPRVELSIEKAKSRGWKPAYSPQEVIRRAARQMTLA